MKIMIDGVARDMTVEEEEAFRAEHINLPPEPAELSIEGKAEAYDIIIGAVQ